MAGVQESETSDLLNGGNFLTSAIRLSRRILSHGVSCKAACLLVATHAFDFLRFAMKLAVTLPI